MFFVVSYDISDNKKRLRMAKTMLDFGDRVQDSVFECRMDNNQLNKLLRRLDKLIGIEDSVRLYALCAKCEASIKIIGREEQFKDNKVFIV